MNTAANALILALDTSSDACSVALTDAQGLRAQQYQCAPRQHHALLLGMMAQALREGHREKSDLNAIAVSVGPGSFTGLRLGIAVAQGVSWGLGLPLIPVCSLQAMAYGMRRQCAARVEDADQEPCIWVSVDASRGQVYWAGYRYEEENAMMRVLSVPALCDDNVMAMHQAARDQAAITGSGADPARHWAIGNGWRKSSGAHNEDQNKSILFALDLVRTDCYPRAQDVAVLARAADSQALHRPASAVQPVYLRQRVV